MEQCCCRIMSAQSWNKTLLSWSYFRNCSLLPSSIIYISWFFFGALSACKYLNYTNHFTWSQLFSHCTAKGWKIASRKKKNQGYWNTHCPHIKCAIERKYKTLEIPGVSHHEIDWQSNSSWKPLPILLIKPTSALSEKVNGDEENKKTKQTSETLCTEFMTICISWQPCARL